MGISNFINWMIPKSLRFDIDKSSKSKFILGTASGLLLVGLLNLARQAAVGNTINAIVIIFALILLGIAWAVFRKTGSLMFISNFITFLMFALMTFLNIVFGGISSTTGSWWVVRGSPIHFVGRMDGSSPGHVNNTGQT